MPAGRSQDSSTLYAVIVFVVLFIISTALAVIFYLKTSDYQKTVQDTEKKIEELATGKEVRSIGALVGTKLPRKTILGTLLARYDELTAMILGSVPEEASAEAKLEMAKQQRSIIVNQITDIIGSDANSVGLVRDLELLKSRYDESATLLTATNDKLLELEKMFNEQKNAAIEQEREMSAAIKRLQQDANSATSSYETLKAAMQQSSDQQVAALATKLDQADQNLRSAQQELLLTQAKLKSAESRITGLQNQLESIVPKPDNLSAALKPDGKILSVDDSTKTVIINLGRVDHVYRGLTFAVYDKSLPIPRSGKGKADIEVFDVQKDVSVARITQADKRNPVMAGDVIANLIWKANAKREFVVAGDFKFGQGIATIKDLIKQWGGTVADNVSITTNYVVLGTAPKVLNKPTVEEIAADPLAMEKYDAAVAALQRYNNVVSEAGTLSIPVFDLERFLDFIGFTRLDP
jgi:NAD-dependent DNA ligase